MILLLAQTSRESLSSTRATRPESIEDCQKRFQEALSDKKVIDLEPVEGFKRTMTTMTYKNLQWHRAYVQAKKKYIESRYLGWE